LQNRCHTFLNFRHVCKTCVFHDALQEGKKKEVHRTPLIMCPRALTASIPRYWWS
jgi:hypothetical protein